MPQSSQSIDNSLDNIKQQVKFSNGLVISQKQSKAVNSALTNEIIIIPSTSQPAFGSMFLFDLREMNVMVHNLTLQINLGRLTCTGTGTGYPYFSPTYYIVNRILILQSQNIIDTLYGNQQ